MNPVHWSHLKYMARSAAHYKASLAEIKDTARMRLGRVADALIFEGDPPAIWDGDRRQGKAWDEFEAANTGRDIVTRPEFERACRMADAVCAHREAMRVLSGQRHVEIDWNFQGRRCQSHPDVVADLVTSAGKPPELPHITDLKGTVSAQPSRFVMQARQMFYHSQLAFYGLAVQERYGVRADWLFNVAVEMAPPWAVTVFRLTDSAREKGELLCASWMANLLVCEESNTFPTYVDHIVDFDVDDEDTELIFEEE